MSKLHYSLILWALCLGACGNDEDGFTVAIDFLGTPSAVIADALTITGAQEGCTQATQVQVFANGREVVPQTPVFLFQWQDVADDTFFFEVTIPQSALDPQIYGIPAVFDATVVSQCGGHFATSQSVALTLMPITERFETFFPNGRFWPGPERGQFWYCDGSTWVLQDSGQTPIQSLPLDFSCVQAQILPTAGTRFYIIAAGQGVAAVDDGVDGHMVLWQQNRQLQGWRLSDDDSLLITYRNSANAGFFVALSAQTGDALFAPVPLGAVFYGPPARVMSPDPQAPDALSAGDYLVLEATRTSNPASLTYSLRRIDAAGADLGVVQMVQYPWDATSYVAAFSNDGLALYLSAGESPESLRLEKKASADGRTLWQNPLSPSGESGFHIPAAVYDDRILVASDDAFRWQDGDSGSVLSLSFAPHSGNRYWDGATLDGGVLALLADANGAWAQGLYLFSPLGMATVKVSSPALTLRSLTPSWNGGLLLGVQDHIVEIQGYDAIVSTQAP